MFWGFAGQVKPAHYPASWAEADRIMDARGPGRVLVFPWHLYTVWSFSDGRIVANPAPAFFAREVLAGDEAGFRSVGTQSPDPFSRYVGDLLRSRQEIRWLGHLVAPLGVRFVVLMEEADWQEYGFLSRQHDLVPVYRSDRLVLFENQAWRGEVFGLDEGAAIAEPSEVFGSAEERDVASRLFPSAPLVSAADGGFPALARRLPNGQRVAATGDPVRRHGGSMQRRMAARQRGADLSPRGSGRFREPAATPFYRGRSLGCSSSATSSAV